MGVIWTPKQQRTKQSFVVPQLNSKYKDAVFSVLPSIGVSHETTGSPLTASGAYGSLVGDARGVALLSALALGSNGGLSSARSAASLTEATLIIVQRPDYAGDSGWHNQVDLTVTKSHWPYGGVIYLSALSTARWVNGISPPASMNGVENVVISGKTNAHALWVNGTLLASSSSQTFGISSLTLGDITEEWQFSGRTYLFIILPRAVSAEEAKALSLNPWQVFAPERRPIFFDVAGGGANTTATLSSTLDAATLIGVGNVTRSGTLAVTLDAATLAGIGGVATSGTLAVTLDAATLTGVGNVTRSGTLAVTLDAATLAGIGTAAVTNKTGTLAVTLDNATLTGIGGVTRSGTLAVTLDAATLSGAGTVAVGTNRDGALASTLADVTLTGVGAVTRSGTLSVTLDGATLSGIGSVGQPRTGTLSATLDNVTLRGIGAIPAAPSTGGGKTTGSNLSRKQKKKLKAVESQEWLKAEETARQLLSDRFTKQTPQEKAQALETHIESLVPVIEALKAITDQIEDVQETVQETKTEELTEHKQILNKFDALITKMTSIEELLIIMLAQ